MIQSTWFEAKNPQYISLVIHGLNLNPERLDFLCQSFVKNHVTARRMVLVGHRGIGGETADVSLDVWERELKENLEQVIEKSEKLQLPYFVWGYSFGALLFLKYFLSTKLEKKPDKLIFFAPPLVLRKRCELIKLLQWLPEHWMIPSLAPQDYRSASKLSIKAYKILWELISFLQNDIYQEVTSFPVQVYLNKHDEFINSIQTEKFIQEKWNKHLNIHWVHKTHIYHHLFIDDECMDKDEWNVIFQKMLSFLFKT